MDDPDLFTAADDSLHTPSDNFYETETYWFSFFVPERAIGGWLYASVRQNAGVTAGGMWLWDATSALPWELPFYQNFDHLKPPRETAPGRIEFPIGLSVQVVEPGRSYDLVFDDRDRVEVKLRFESTYAPVPLRSGAPPYPRASHFDQTGRTYGTVVLDGERIDVDCYAMRDRSWGPRYERGYRRVGYTWASSADLSLLTYTAPDGSPTGGEHIHSGYVRRGTGPDAVSQVTDGRRTVKRDPEQGWITGIDMEFVDAVGRRTTASAETLSRMVLPGSTSICVNTSLRWTVTDHTGETVVLDGEDQDVWPIAEWRLLRSPKQ
ncbi:DUF7065 domain-containing protein [Pseudonocardia pini]|uniref:DUF7065 domain-containing protein n=1 Tax=Pseudonocardia pini TaxID=2758030 RepID=UPI001C68FC9F|nr:hypothetical protein [Pseudonocardia pini]